MAHEGNEQFKQQLATGKPHRNSDSITPFWVTGCFMRTMRLPLHQIEQDNKLKDSLSGDYIEKIG